MGSSFSATISIFFAITLLATHGLAAGFYYAVFQWPGSYCNTKHGCCYPKTAKPAEDFTIGGFWPDDLLNSMPKYCNNHSAFNISEIQDLKKGLDKSWPALRCPSRNGWSLWRHEWQKYGTCSGLTQRQYFKEALAVKYNVDLLKVLQNAGIEPNGNSYSLSVVHDAIENAFIFLPALLCNRDKLGTYQLFQIVFCIEADGKVTDCPAFPGSECGNMIKFPPF